MVTSSLKTNESDNFNLNALSRGEHYGVGSAFALIVP